MVSPPTLSGDGIVLQPRWFRAGRRSFEPGGARTFTVHDPDTGSLLGGASLDRLPPGRGRAEVGYWLSPEAGGPAVAIAALRTVAVWAFDNGLDRLELIADQDDPGRLRAALDAGFRPEGVRRAGRRRAKGAPKDAVVLARLADDPAEPAIRALPDLPGERLTDGVVEIRPLQPSDVDEYLALHRVPDVQRYHLGEPVTRSVAGARCQQAAYRWVAGEAARCVIVEAATGAFAGEVQLLCREPAAGAAVLGFAVRPEFRGKGFAARAVSLLVDWAFTVDDVLESVALVVALAVGVVALVSYVRQKWSDRRAARRA